MWKKTTIPHSNGSKLDLYCMQNEYFVSIAICEDTPKTKLQLNRETLNGNLTDLVWNQYGLPIQWEDTENIFETWPCEYDARQSKDDGKQPLQNIRYSIGNAIISIRNNLHFNKIIKNNIEGVWKSDDGIVRIMKDNFFEMDNSLAMLRSVSVLPPIGRWSATYGTLLVQKPNGDGGRVQILDLNETKLIFGGCPMQLTYEFERVAE